MADTKKYYYLKIKENFYESEELILLQNAQDGYLYSDILMKLYLRSLKNNGKLMFKDIIPYTPEALSQVVRHPVGVVKQALEMFKMLGLIEILDNGAIYMTDIQNFIGKSSTEGDRIRAFRNRINTEKLLENKKVVQMYDKRTPEIEIELELEKELDKKEKIYKKEKNQETAETPKGISESVLENEFEDIWKLYPNKKGKTVALKQYIKARKKGTTLEAIKNGIEKYVEYINQTKQNARYIKHGSTYFNQECWNDDYDIKNETTTEDLPEWFYEKKAKAEVTETEREEMRRMLDF